MKDALVGYTGFVGSTLLRQREFTALYRSTNIHELNDQQFDTIVCAGAPAQKWIANSDPKADERKINSLVEVLKTVHCRQFILISTVDVFRLPVKLDEGTPVDESELQPYGLHRRMLEKFVETHFPAHLIVRLPGLIGPGLRKNVIFDLLNNNNLHLIDSRGIFQFYPMANLWYDIEVALGAALRLVHLTAEPISVSEVASAGFGKRFDHPLSTSAPRYDMQTRHASLFGVEGQYQYTKRDTLQAVRTYAQFEAGSQGTPKGAQK